MGNFEGSLTSRHTSQLRILLLIGGIEPNPGPALKDHRKATLVSVLKLLKEDDPDFNIPKTKSDVLEAIEREDPKLVRFVLQAVQHQETSTPQAPLPTVRAQFSDDTNKTVKLPEFYASDARIWFEQVEALLESGSDSARKSSLLRSLPTDVIVKSGAKVSDDFQTMKSNIICHYGESDDSLLRRLLQQQHLGDRKPSAAMRELQRLAPGHDNLIKLRFLEILPESVRVVLASLDSVTLEKLAEVADKMLAQLPNHSTGICAVEGKPRELEALCKTVEVMASQLSQLTAQVNAIQIGASRNYIARSPFRQSPSRFSSSRSQSRSSSTMGRYCFYHFNFGRLARKCQSPCAWKNDNTAQSSNDNAPVTMRPPPEQQ